MTKKIDYALAYMRNYWLAFKLHLLFWTFQKNFRFKPKHKFELSWNQNEYPWLYEASMNTKDGERNIHRELWGVDAVEVYHSLEPIDKDPNFKLQYSHKMSLWFAIKSLTLIQLRIRSQETNMPVFLIALLYIAFFVGVAAFGYYFGGSAAEYSLEQWLSYFKNAPVDLPFLPCGILGIFFFWFFIVAALFTYLCSAIF